MEDRIAELCKLERAEPTMEAALGAQERAKGSGRGREPDRHRNDAWDRVRLNGPSTPVPAGGERQLQTP